MSLKVFEGFAGYGGASFAFRKLMEQHPEYDFEVVGYSEIDESAVELFNLNHKDKNGNNLTNFGDITILDPKTIPDFDLFTGVEEVKEELADVLNYCFQMANVLGIDPIDIVNAKMDITEKKYPVDKAKGVSTKYNKL